MVLRYLSGGESHGSALVAIIEGLPAGLYLSSEQINRQLERRQQGYGRGGRMKLEKDRVEFLSGLRFNRTLGSPLTLKIANRDSKNWREIMPPEGERGEGVPPFTLPRPGHADYAGGLKFFREDLRDILERASARETASRTAVGAVARRLLEEMGIEIFGHVVSIGEVQAQNSGVSLPVLRERREVSRFFCCDPRAEEHMRLAIDSARNSGDTLGGVFEIVATGVPPGLGSHTHWDRKLDGRLAGALMSLQGIKGVEIGLGFASSSRRGSRVHDPFHHSSERGLYRSSNRAGGLEGGITNGEPLVLRAAMKPIPTLLSPLPSVNLQTMEEESAAVERSDVCAVPAASVAGEAIVAWELAVALKEKLGGDSVEEMRRSFNSYLEMVEEYLGSGASSKDGPEERNSAKD